MTRWLMATELGGGLGHLVRLRHLARALRRPGDRVLLAAPDVAAAAALFGRDATRFHSSPALPLRRERPLPGFAGILEAFGFADPRQLLATTRRWRALFRETRAEALIADFAPFATFAARGLIPCCAIGSGFDLPPAGFARIPPYAPDDPPADEAPLLRAARQVAGRIGAPHPTSLSAALAGDARHLIGLPWIDPYWGQRRERPLGPLGPRPPLRTPPAEACLFAYCDPDAPSFDALTLTLARLPVRRFIYWRGGAQPVRRLLAESGAELFDALPDPAILLPRSTLVINHGGAGAIADSIFAGRPQICLPHQREADLNARALRALGAGLVPADHHPDTLGWAIRNALEDVALRDRALALGEAAHALFGRDPAAAIARSLRLLVAARA